jgi:hypothetical protein
VKLAGRQVQFDPQFDFIMKTFFPLLAAQARNIPIVNVVRSLSDSEILRNNLLRISFRAQASQEALEKNKRNE